MTWIMKDMHKLNTQSWLLARTQFELYPGKHDITRQADEAHILDQRMV